MNTRARQKPRVVLQAAADRFAHAILAHEDISADDLAEVGVAARATAVMLDMSNDREAERAVADELMTRITMRLGWRQDEPYIEARLRRIWETLFSEAFPSVH